jgi:NADPH:quinone reductase-like Zn-dependent oxidoreductase
MKAIAYDKYSSFDVLALKDIDKPAAKEGEVLVRVRAVSLQIGDCFSVRGAPYMMRMYTGLLKPKWRVSGFDFAGTVEGLGDGAKQFQQGDEVFGSSQAACAKYAVAREDQLAPKPGNLSFEEAAAIPTAALTALRGLRDVGKVLPGQKVLINGASGGVGHFAVQIAKALLGAEVPGVCSTKNVEMVRSIGADHVIDYTKDDFTKGGGRYDVILDNVENRSLSDIRRALKPAGTLVLNSGTGARGIGMMVRLVQPLVLSPFSRQSLRRYLVKPNHKDLVYLKDLAKSGKLRPVIDKTYPLSETAAALAYIEAGHAAGKVVVTIDN